MSTLANRPSTDFEDDSMEDIASTSSEICDIQLLSDLSCTYLNKSYLLDLSNMPVISDYLPNKALQFLRNTSKYQRAQYVSHQSIASLQGNKEDVINKGACIRPKLRIPDVYKQMIDKNNPTVMCVICVKEYDLIGTGEIVYCIVSTKKFFKRNNTEGQKQFEKVFSIPLTPENTGNSIHELTVFIVAVPHRIDNEFGPVLFKLNEQYFQTARSDGVEFGPANPSHRLALFLCQLNKETNKFVPDWETLCLSDYIHQKKKE